MNLLEAVSHMRTQILDDTGGVGVDWSNYDKDAFGSLQFRWTNEEITSNINSAITKASVSVNPFRTLINLKIGQNKNTVTIPSYVKKIIRIKRSDGVLLEEIGIDDIFDMESSETKTGEIVAWIPDYETKVLRTYPIDTSSDQTLSCLVYRMPKNDFVWDTDQETDIEYFTDTLPFVLYYASHLCYLKDEANTLDPNRSNMFLTLFEREFPHTSTYSSIRKERTANRPVKYGGY